MTPEDEERIRAAFRRLYDEHKRALMAQSTALRAENRRLSEDALSCAALIHGTRRLLELRGAAVVERMFREAALGQLAEQREAQDAPSFEAACRTFGAAPEIRGQA